MPLDYASSTALELGPFSEGGKRWLSSPPAPSAVGTPPPLLVQSVHKRVPVVAERYDEVLFVDPVEAFYELLVQGGDQATFWFGRPPLHHVGGWGVWGLTGGPTPGAWVWLPVPPWVGGWEFLGPSPGGPKKKPGSDRPPRPVSVALEISSHGHQFVEEREVRGCVGACTRVCVCM